MGKLRALLGCSVPVLCLLACSAKKGEERQQPSTPVSAAAPVVSSPAALDAAPGPISPPPPTADFEPARVFVRLPSIGRIATSGDSLYVTSQPRAGRASDDVRTDIFTVSKKAGTPKLVQGKQPPTHSIVIAKGMLFYRSVVSATDNEVELRRGDGSVFAKPLPTIDGEAVAVGTDLVFFNPKTELVRKPIAGGEETVITKLDAHASDRPLVADAAHVYLHRIERGQEEIVKVPLKGGSPVVLASTKESVVGMATDGNHVYFTAGGGLHRPGGVWRVSTRGGDIENISRNQMSVWPIALDERYVYWGTEYGVMRRAKAGGTEQMVGRSAGMGLSIAVDNDFVYWDGNDDGMEESNAVYRVALPRLPRVTP